MALETVGSFEGPREGLAAGKVALRRCLREETLRVEWLECFGVRQGGGLHQIWRVFASENKRRRGGEG